MVPRDSLEFQLFSGNYESVLERTASQHDASTTPVMIGALALSGRLDEAQSAFRNLCASASDPAAITQARFYITAGLCHAGQVHKALQQARVSLSESSSSDRRARFWIWQGLALVRFFEGRFGRARGLARRALASAVEAAFPYARVLALDLLAHVLVHTGEVFAGTRLLEQAATLADQLGYAANTTTLRTEVVVFRLQFLSTGVRTAIADAEAALAAPLVSYFTRRNGLIELGATLALAGEGPRAASALEEARRISLPGSDRRGKTRWLIAHALTTVLSRGPNAAGPIFEEARALAGGQRMLEAEIGFVEAIFGEPRAEARAHLLEVAAATGILRARVACAFACGSDPPAAHQEDRLCRILIECRGTPADRRLRLVLDAGLLGLVPWALTVTPGRRLVLTGKDLVTEDRGFVTARPAPSGPSLRLLLALQGGYQSRETLVSSVWGLGRYNPSKHNPVIHTAISRLRLALGDPSWIVTEGAGYALADGIEILSPDAPAAAAPSPPASAPPADHARVLECIQRHGPQSSAEVARALRMSASTALRLLRRLAQEGHLLRIGGGRSTRYDIARG